MATTSRARPCAGSISLPTTLAAWASMTLVQLASGAVFAQDYRILRPLAEGGMGAVYVAEQLSTGKERALKVMLPQLVTDAKHRARFAQEARASAPIESDHV